jgi:two-component system sensor histidine kinase KdpD
MLFLTSILLVSARYDFFSGLIASLLSYLVYNFLFTAPEYTLKVDDDGDLATLLFFLLIAAIGGHLAARIHDEMEHRQRSLEELEEARLTSEREQLRSALLSSLSHDLRTPLASVIGSLTSIQELEEVLDAGQRRELLRNALDEGKRLDRYIQNLLDMTRLGQGRLKIERSWTDLHDIISGAARRLGLVPNQPPLEVDIPAGSPLLWVHGTLIEQALVNLLDNALRFTPPGGKVKLSFRPDGNQAVIDICDEGPGIPVQEREKVFEMFHTSSDRGGHGTGLGLAICRGMVAAHAGTVEAGAGPGGRGARMTIRLPLYDAAPGPADS